MASSQKPLDAYRGWKSFKKLRPATLCLACRNYTVAGPSGARVLAAYSGAQESAPQNGVVPPFAMMVTDSYNGVQHPLTPSPCPRRRQVRGARRGVNGDQERVSKLTKRCPSPHSLPSRSGGSPKTTHSLQPGSLPARDNSRNVDMPDEAAWIRGSEGTRQWQDWPAGRVTGAGFAVPWNVFVLGLASHSLSVNYPGLTCTVRLAVARLADIETRAVEISYPNAGLIS